jgi:hypothetical protein
VEIHTQRLSRAGTAWAFAFVEVLSRLRNPP